MTTSEAGPLVSGATNKRGDGVPDQVEIEVVRSFRYRGEHIEVGERLKVPTIFAIELRTGRKARFVTEEAPDVGPIVPESADEAGSEPEAGASAEEASSEEQKPAATKAKGK